MKVLVLSDSHSVRSIMRTAVSQVKPNAIVHLGDHYEDGEVMGEENMHIPLYQVPGNCDKYRMMRYEPEIRCSPVGGVMMYMTHGHNHHVKLGLGAFLADARKYGAQVALYGHTHVADCHREADGLWVMNPGSAGYGGNSAGIVETDEQAVTACYLLTEKDLEEINASNIQFYLRCKYSISSNFHF